MLTRLNHRIGVHDGGGDHYSSGSSDAQENPKKSIPWLHHLTVVCARCGADAPCQVAELPGCLPWSSIETHGTIYQL
jgi:hypothetical protein